MTKEVRQLRQIVNFLQKLNFEGTGCITWKGSLNLYGYGQVAIDEKNWKAHRFSYELFKGKIKEGLMLDHICRNRTCVNPEHLRQVTNKQNVLENSEAVTAKNAKKLECIRGHAFSGKNLRIDKKGYRVCKECFKMHRKKYRERHR